LVHPPLALLATGHGRTHVASCGDYQNASMSPIQIRPATADDVPLIFALICELASYEKLSHEVVANEDQIRQTLFGERSVAEVVIATLNDVPVGFALFFPNYSTFLGRPGLYLEDLYVRPEARGFGAGRELLEYLARLAVERGWGRLEWRVLDWNEPSIAFYKKLGAEPLDDWTVFRVTGQALRRLAGS
jgi:GNAT superfamily N-acetyltransferase